VGDGRALVQKPRQVGSWRRDRGLHGLKLGLVGVTQLGANRGTYSDHNEHDQPHGRLLVITYLNHACMEASCKRNRTSFC
jgi:hypothetical protein